MDDKTLLFLSGGDGILPLYKLIVKDSKHKIKPAAVATVDERWGPPGHENSKEEMIRRTGIYAYFV